MGEYISKVLQNNQNQDGKPSDQIQEREVLKQQSYNKSMQQVQTYIRKNNISETPYRLSFLAVHHLKQIMEENEKSDMIKLKTRYIRNTYFITLVALCSAFIVPLPFRYMQKTQSFKKVLIWISIFGLTHKTGMYAIQQEVYDYQKLLIRKYQQEILTTNFKNID